MPTPGDLARAPRRPLTAHRAVDSTRPAPATPIPPGAHARQQWEAAVLRSGLYSNARLVALALASLVDWETGLIPDDRQPGVPVLARACGGLYEQHVRASLHYLIAGGWISRRTGEGLYPAPIQLLLPAHIHTAR